MTGSGQGPCLAARLSQTIWEHVILSFGILEKVKLYKARHLAR
jgi:hypothetical protein